MIVKQFMKPFNLEEYLNNPLKKVVTRDGKNVRIICTDHDNMLYPIIGAVEGRAYPTIFSACGLAVGSAGDSPDDLFFAPEKHEGWALIYTDAAGDSCLGSSRIFESEDAAKEHVVRVRGYGIKIAKIEWEE